MIYIEIYLYREVHDRRLGQIPTHLTKRVGLCLSNISIKPNSSCTHLKQNEGPNFFDRMDYDIRERNIRKNSIREVTSRPLSSNKSERKLSWKKCESIVNRLHSFSNPTLYKSRKHSRSLSASGRMQQSFKTSNFLTNYSNNNISLNHKRSVVNIIPNKKIDIQDQNESNKRWTKEYKKKIISKLLQSQENIEIVNFQCNTTKGKTKKKVFKKKIINKPVLITRNISENSLQLSKLSEVFKDKPKANVIKNKSTERRRSNPASKRVSSNIVNLQLENCMTPHLMNHPIIQSSVSLFSPKKCKKAMKPNLMMESCKSKSVKMMHKQWVR